MGQKSRYIGDSISRLEQTLRRGSKHRGYTLELHVEILENTLRGFVEMQAPNGTAGGICGSRQELMCLVDSRFLLHLDTVGIAKNRPDGLGAAAAGDLNSELLHPWRYPEVILAGRAEEMKGRALGVQADTAPGGVHGGSPALRFTDNFVGAALSGRELVGLLLFARGGG